MSPFRTSTRSATSADDSPADASLVERMLDEVEVLLNAGEFARAEKRIAECRVRSPLVANALAVCHIRQGTPQRAIEILRPQVLQPGGLLIRDEASPLLHANFAIALLASGNLDGFRKSLDDTRTVNDPALDRLRHAYADWRSGLSFWQKLKLTFASESPEGGPMVAELASLR